MFRQPKVGDWDAVFREVARALETVPRLADPLRPLVPHLGTPAAELLALANLQAGRYSRDAPSSIPLKPNRHGINQQSTNWQPAS
jgi:hypothetical protein